ncbi:MAG: 3-deoxy-manno-octulosonate cytidylyltransferase [Rhodospirillales bacterium]|nr:3-deoxy-manno-octulosonate cytidylyltransferase [Rhodospirillales bacterium]
MIDGPVCIIPARMASSRYPGKPLEPLLGLALVLHVYERCRLYQGFSEVVIATCDDEIMQAAEAHGAPAVMTANTHERCTDRVQEAIETRYPDMPGDSVVVMVQGDEVLVSPEMIADVLKAQSRTGAPVVNLGSRLTRTEDHDDPNTVKVVAGADGRALCFSRAPIPFRNRGEDVPMFQQTGIMAFTHGFLKQFAELPQTPLEIAESVDMMRVLEHGISLFVAFTETQTIGVDTPDDKARGEEILAADPLTERYLSLS